MPLTKEQIKKVLSFYRERVLPDGFSWLRSFGETFSGHRWDLLLEDKNGFPIMVVIATEPITTVDCSLFSECLGLSKYGQVLVLAPSVSAAVRPDFQAKKISYGIYDPLSMAEIFEPIKTKLIMYRSVVQELPKIDLLELTYFYDTARAIQRPPRPRRPSVASPQKPKANKPNAKTRAKRPKTSKNLPKPKPRVGFYHIAFKVTFVDSQWNGVCSDDCYEKNIELNRVWCVRQEEDCRYEDYDDKSKLTEEWFPCYDSVALKFLMFSPGFYHSGRLSGRPQRTAHAKTNKLMVLTSRSQEEKESRRFIFAIARIAEIKRIQGGGQCFCGDQETAIVFRPNDYLPFWKYHKNPRARDTQKWGSRLFRYMEETTLQEILHQIVRNPHYSQVQRKAAEKLMRWVHTSKN